MDKILYEAKISKSIFIAPFALSFGSVCAFIFCSIKRAEWLEKHQLWWWLRGTGEHISSSDIFLINILCALSLLAFIACIAQAVMGLIRYNSTKIFITQDKIIKKNLSCIWGIKFKDIKNIRIDDLGVTINADNVQLGCYCIYDPMGFEKIILECAPQIKETA